MGKEQAGNPQKFLRAGQTGQVKHQTRIVFLTPEQKEAVGEKASGRVSANNPEKVVAQLVDFYQQFIGK